MAAEDSYSIDELAQAAGMTARNVRAYRTKGLLPPPVRSGRVSRYRTAHLHRLRDIRELRDAGLPLKLIMAAVSSGDNLGPDGRLRLLAARLDPPQVVDLRDEPAPTVTRAPTVDVPQQRDAVRRLVEIGLAPASAQLVSRGLTQQVSQVAAFLGDAVTAQNLSVQGRSGVADLTVQLTGVAVRKALGVPD